MKNPTHSKLTSLLKVDFSEKNTLWLKSSSALRRLVGIIGMGLWRHYLGIEFFIGLLIQKIHVSPNLVLQLPYFIKMPNAHK